MKKILLLIIIVGALLMLLCSCGECEHSWGSPTCVSPSTCSLCGDQTGSTIPHEYGSATCTEPKACTMCGEKKGEPLGHTAEGATCNRLALCTTCGESVGEYAEHKPTMADCTTPSHCSVCKIQLSEALGHSMVEATCTEDAYCSVCLTVEANTKGHRLEPATCFSPKTCSLCDYTQGEPLDHNWVGDTCMERKECSLCHTLGEITEHVWISSTCTNEAHCKNCSEKKGEPLGHDWQGTTCLEPSTCTRCGETTTDTENLAHRFIFAGCTRPGYCAYCQLVQKEAPGHKLVPASCDAPEHCTECTYKVGAALGHDWVEVSCKAPKHCTRCEITVGVALEHKFEFFQRIEPSCSEGATVDKCTACGEEKRTVIYPVRDHHVCDENGLCSYCDTRYDVSKMTLTSISISSSFEVINQGIFLSDETASKIYKPITSEDLGIPVVELNGNLGNVGTGSFIDIPFTYEGDGISFDCIAKVRVQGASSAGYAKKNYSIKLYDADGSKHKVKLAEDWGKQFKYCLKANWVDYSQARNVVSGQLYGDVIDARDYIDELTNLPSGGAIDGFPCVVFNNGRFLGLYTFNIPKDKWMFDMDDSDEKKQAIVMAITWNDEVAMRKELSYNQYGSTWTGSSGWELEYASNEDSLVDNNTTWVAESLNNLVRFVMNNNGEDFKNGIHQYADVDKCIDSMLYTFFICADDNISKNILWATYDGVHWFSSMYDMDGTWGMQWNGNLSFRDANTHLINVLESHNNNRYNLLWEKIYINFYDRVVARYLELRGSVYTMEHITERFEAFFNQIPQVVRAAEKAKWTGVPTQNEDHLAQILDYARKRIEKMDEILVYKD